MKILEQKYNISFKRRTIVWDQQQNRDDRAKGQQKLSNWHNREKKTR